MFGSGDYLADTIDGTLYQPGSFGSSTPASVLYDISYELSLTGKETVSDSSTATGKAPDISAFEQYGLCCASFATYYLPSIDSQMNLINDYEAAITNTS